MMVKLKALLNNQWFFPILMLYYGVFYILFGETYPFQGGFSVDGFVFASFVQDFRKSFYFDSYYVHRILPSLLVGGFLKLLSLNPTASHIFTAFQILNLASIVLSCFFLKQILLFFKISLKNQLLAFALFLLNFGIVKFPFYLPVMTDTFALMLSTALLYFYLKNNVIGIIISTLLLAFTSTMAYYQGLILIAFPISILPLIQPLKWQKTVIYGTSVLFILVLIIIFIFIQKRDLPIGYFYLRIDHSLLPLSIVGTALLFFFWAKLFLNKTLLDIPLFFKKLDYKRILLSVGVFALAFIIIQILHPKSTAIYSTSKILLEPTIYAVARPLVHIVSHISYFGILVCLLLVFWSSFCKTLSQAGWGLVAALALNLYLFGHVSETRRLINLLPLLTVFLTKSLNKYTFSNSFYIVVGLMCVAASKIWLLVNSMYDSASSSNLDKNGSIGFPGQLFWMSIGPWMSEQMYYVQGIVMFLLTGILFFMLYKFELNEFGKLRLIRKYQILK